MKKIFLSLFLSTFLMSFIGCNFIDELIVTKEEKYSGSIYSKVNKEDKAYNEYDGRIQNNTKNKTEDNIKNNIEIYNSLTNGNFTTNSKYVGLTVKEFVDKGAEIQGSTGLNGYYIFSGKNNLTNEMNISTLL